MSKKLLSLLLVLALALTMSATAFADYYSSLLPAVKTIPSEYTGKTIILHSNDVHGAIDGYAYMTALKQKFLDAGASHVIVTSYVFHGGTLDEERLEKMKDAVGIERLVLDLSCRRQYQRSAY